MVDGDGRQLQHNSLRMRVTALALYMFCAFGLPAHAASVSVTIMDAGELPVSDAVVYATASARPPPAKSGRTATIAQVNRTFVPYVTVVQAGTAVSFPNKDEIRHHVYSFSPAKIFDLKLYTGVPMSPIVFDKPGPVVLGCNIHDWMVGYIYVVDTPHFAKTENGAARIDALAPGDYELRVWHSQSRGEPPMQRIKIGSADMAAKFTLRLTPAQSTATPPPPGKY